MIMRPYALTVFVVLTLAANVRAGEIGWIEQFSLATDRDVPLKQLIPGTEDYYYYHCLHYQNIEQWDKVQPLLKAWVDRYQWTARAIEIQNRQALLTYKAHPAESLELIRQRLNLQFNHQREQLNQKPTLPTKLDPALIASERLTKQAFEQFPNSLQGFEPIALEWLVSRELNPFQRRQLLSLLQWPDYPKLPQLVVDDLNFENSGGFGQFAIHRQLLRAQLDACLKLMPGLLGNSNFVETYVKRLHPSDDANWRQNPLELTAYLDRLWEFVASLNPSFNSLKAHVLYHRLVLDRKLGKYNPELFLEYLKLPKNVPYISAKFMEPLERRERAANLGQDYTGITMLPPIGDDEPLVRSYLMHFFVDAKDFKEFAPYVNDEYFERLFAETKILHGLGDAEKWYAWLPPEIYQQLKERIELDFLPTNKTEFGVEDPIGLDLDVKNVETLIVKVFEINTQNYYRENRRAVGTDIHLDGLVAAEEHTFKYAEPPLRRVRRHFEFAKLTKRGVYVIDFIGNGKASRALVHKGQLRYLVRTSVAGHVFTVLDENNKHLPEATLWLAGTLYTPGKSGTITVPFTNQPGQQQIVLADGGFASRATFEQQSENYSLQAGMYVDREELIARRKAQLIVRPQLVLNGTPVTLKVLEEVRLAIVSTDLDNVVSNKEVPDFKLFEDRETTYEFQVPQRLANIRFVLTAKVQNQSQNKKLDLSATQSFSLNEIDRTEKTEDLHFSHVASGYVLDLLGKTGETKADRPVQLVLKMRDYTQPVHVTLQTNEQGRIELGALSGVAAITATSPQGVAHTWTLPRDEHSYQNVVQSDVDTAIDIPYMGPSKKPERSELSLLELRNDAFVADRFENLKIADGLLKIEKLPVGDYSLLLKRTGAQIKLRITAGPVRDRYVLGDYRKLEVRNRRPLQIASVDVGEKKINVQLANATKLARVHVFATRFEPAYSAFGQMARIRAANPLAVTTPRVESQYTAGRNIGDEYRYIIDRKFARKFPGNMLERPSLLLNPWAIRSTETGEQSAQSGEDFQNMPLTEMQSMSGAYGGHAKAINPSDFADLDFLAESSLVMVNVAADEKGRIEIKREDLGDYQELLFVAVDPENTASRIVNLPAAKADYLDLRLAKGLDPKQHFTQQKRISVLAADEKLVINDITSARFEIFDSLSRVVSLYTAINPDAKLAEFSFVRNWPSHKLEEKRELYKKFASHELHMFLYRHDPDFFKQAIRPYLANKKDKQILDRWLLDADLSDYLKPWNFEQLNTFERILLAQRSKADGDNTLRLIKNQFELLPPDPDRFNHLFETALKGSSLDTDDRLGHAVVIDELNEKAYRALVTRSGRESADMPAETAPEAPAAPPAPSAEPESLADESEKKPAKAKFRLEAAPLRKQAEMNRLKKREGGKDKEQDGADDAKGDVFFDEDSTRLGAVAQYYRKLDKTMEWVESNYFKLPIAEQTSALIATNSFWKEYAEQKPGQPFHAKNLAEATHNFPEMLMALALVDLPFEAGEHKTEFKAAQMTLSAASPMIVYHEEIQPAEKVAEHTPILVNQNFFRHGDRYRQVGGEQQDKFITDEFLIDTVYGCHIVATNPSSSRKRVEVLLQIPTGALPVVGGRFTRSVHLDLEPYHTQTLEYYFYFPRAGKFTHYPVQIATGGEVLAFAEAFEFNVVSEPTNVDKESWDYISQHGSPDDVINFLKTQNVLQVNLDRIAWRMQEKPFFKQVIELLAAQHIYNNTLWSYGIKHDDPPAVRQFLQFANEFVAQCGDWLDSPLLVINPVIRKTYEQMDYKPLVNARVGQLGRQREIVNDRFLAQYQRLLKILSYRRQLDNEELMATTYYLLLQDRVADAIGYFDRVEAETLPTRLQYDYFAAYLHMSKSEPKLARKIAAKYAEYPVDRWRTAFVDVVHQVDEIGEEAAQVVDPEDRTQVQTSQAAASPSFDFSIEGRKVRLSYQNLTQIRVSYYLMDIELLFSRNPFVQGEAKQFSYIVPNQAKEFELPAKATSFEFALPDDLATSNVLVEITGASEAKSKVYFSNVLRVQLTENYGQVRVTHGKNANPLSKVYVKVYARMQDGSVGFYKDGYTDLRGRFDYSSLSTNALDHVEKFALLILSEEHGAVVREARGRSNDRL